MEIKENVPLASLTTFRIGGPARFVLDVANVDEVPAALLFAKEHSLPLTPLGGGSNILAADSGYRGVLLHPLFGALSITEQGGDALVVADAGLAWDALVAETVAKGFWGLENLAGIPGTVGAAPVQNIGAYGVELESVLAWVDAYDATGMLHRIEKSACGFGYRTSRFKREPGFVIVRAAFQLSREPNPKLSYADLRKRVEAGEVLDTPEQIAACVRTIRSGKFPDLTQLGTAGSFFKNPIIAASAYAALKEKYPEMPGFPSATGDVKVSLAWILDHVLKLRGFSVGHARLFEAQPLVIAAEHDATESEVRTLADTVAARVKETTGIALEWEVRALS